MPPRVLFTIGSMHIGGAEKVVAHLARGLAAAGSEVAICCTRFLGALGGQLRGEGFTVDVIAPPSRAKRHLTSWYLRRCVRRFQPDVIHTHGTPALIHTGPLGALGLLPPWVHTFHFGNYDARNDAQTIAERYFCRGATRLVAVSESQREAVMRRHKVRPDRIMTIVNGVEQNKYVGDAESRARIRAEFGFAPDDLVVGVIAVLSTQKGIPFFLDAVPLVAAQHPAVRFIVVGGGPLEAELRAHAAALGLEQRVLFTGWRDDSLAIMPALDTFVMSSLWEAMPMVLLEAMAAARPIVVTDVGDNRKVVDDGRCGVVVPSRDAAALAAAISALVADRGRASEMGRRAAERFEREFTTARMVERHQALYGELTAASPRLQAASSTAVPL